MPSKPKPAMSPSDVPVEEVLAKVSGPRRAEAEQLLGLCAEVSGAEPAVWARRIVGFGSFHYRYATGREGDAPLVGFATNDREHTLYLVGDYETRWAAQLATLGTYRAGKGCLYLKRLGDVDLDVLRAVLERTVRVHRGADTTGV